MSKPKKDTEIDSFELMGHFFLTLIALPIAGLILSPIFLIFWSIMQYGISINP